MLVVREPLVRVRRHAPLAPAAPAPFYRARIHHPRRGLLDRLVTPVRHPALDARDIAFNPDRAAAPARNLRGVNETKTATLLKDGHLFVARFNTFDDAQAVAFAVDDWIGKPGLNFDSFDAALLQASIEAHATVRPGARPTRPILHPRLAIILWAVLTLGGIFSRKKH